MHNSKSVLENKTHKLLWDFEIQTDHLTRPEDQTKKKKKKKKKENLPKKKENFSVTADHIEKKDKYLDFAWELKKL